MRTLSNAYCVVKFNRNKAKAGFVRPTLGQLIKPNMNYIEVLK